MYLQMDNLGEAFPNARVEYSVLMAVEQEVDGESVWTHVEIARVPDKDGVIRRIVEICRLEKQFPKGFEVRGEMFVAKTDRGWVEVLKIVPVYVEWEAREWSAS